ncbi:MAG: DUF2254 domain-containing protein [Jiangellaceae bacterium]|nr:DUF2254 domain-containing protein [Jiangellaceae bacterium]
MMDREALHEYARGALWVLPGLAGMTALLAGSMLSQVDIGPDSPLAPFVFQGTADDARGLLITITGTVVTVIALTLGLTVVALQLSSTQFSPRLLRNFLRDRPNQVVLSVFVATFTYSAAGLYTVGVSAGERVERYPRLAITGAMVLLFVSLAAVVYFADHLAHSIQIDAIIKRVESETVRMVRHGADHAEEVRQRRPDWAVALTSSRSGYMQRVHPEAILPVAARHGVTIRLRPHIGEHVVAGTALAWIWRASADEPTPDPQTFRRAVEGAVRVGFERTLEQDVGFGIRQLTDVACKALSPAINDPYTAAQSIDHLSVIFAELAQRPLGDLVERDPTGRGAVVVPGRNFPELLSFACGMIRRYGAREPTVLLALLRLLGNCAEVTVDPERLAVIDDEASLILTHGEATIAQSADVVQVRLAAEAVHNRVRVRQSAAAA